MNPVLLLTHNCMELTQKCILSIKNQDIETSILVVDNNSTDGTYEWLKENANMRVQFSPQVGVSVGWNFGLRYLFERDKAEYVLVVNNDTILPSFFYAALLKCNVPFVTGAAVQNMESLNPIKGAFAVASLTPGPNFSAFLIRREAWEKIGPFDEQMKFYAQDCDYDVRAHRLGMQLWNAHIPFYHECSSTLRWAPEPERIAILQRANDDREAFRQKYNCLPGTAEYAALFETAVC